MKMAHSQLPPFVRAWGWGVTFSAVLFIQTCRKSDLQHPANIPPTQRVSPRPRSWPQDAGHFCSRNPEPLIRLRPRSIKKLVASATRQSSRQLPGKDAPHPLLMRGGLRHQALVASGKRIKPPVWSSFNPSPTQTNGPFVLEAHRRTLELRRNNL